MTAPSALVRTEGDNHNDADESRLQLTAANQEDDRRRIKSAIEPLIDHAGPLCTLSTVVARTVVCYLPVTNFQACQQSGQLGVPVVMTTPTAGRPQTVMVRPGTTRQVLATVPGALWVIMLRPVP